jgi:myosin protein heavy chain
LQGPRLLEQRPLVCLFADLNYYSHTFIAVRRSLADIEKAQSEAIAERNVAEQKLQDAEKKVQELEAKLEEEGRESSDLDMLHQRLSEELEDERKQHIKDLADRDFTTDQTRKKYQGNVLM